MLLAHSVSLNEAERVNNGKTATENPPPAKKIRKCQKMKKEPVAGGKADNDRTEDKQGQLPDIHRPGSTWASKGVSGRGEGRPGGEVSCFFNSYFFLS